MIPVSVASEAQIVHPNRSPMETRNVLVGQKPKTVERMRVVERRVTKPHEGPERELSDDHGEEGHYGHQRDEGDGGSALEWIQFPGEPKPHLKLYSFSIRSICDPRNLVDPVTIVGHSL